MSKPKIHGFPQSSYVWSTRAAFALKGVDVDFVPMTPGDHKQPAHLAKHPWGKVPAMEHDGLTLHETDAIARYADEAFDGPALMPADAKGRAVATKWISNVNCYGYNAIVPGYLFVKDDPAKVAATLPKVRTFVEQLSHDIGDGTFVAGTDKPTIADVVVAPLLFVLSQLPEGQQILAANPGAQRLMGAMAETPEFMSVGPPR